MADPPDEASAPIYPGGPHRTAETMGRWPEAIAEAYAAGAAAERERIRQLAEKYAGGLVEGSSGHFTLWRFVRLLDGAPPIDMGYLSLPAEVQAAAESDLPGRAS